MSRDHSGYTALVLPTPSGPIITELDDGEQANGVTVGRMGALPRPFHCHLPGSLTVLPPVIEQKRVRA
jgi:hypothetical protein